MTRSASSPTNPSFIDLHSHTNFSDGSLTPGELVSLADETGLRALAITDHDTFEGYEAARRTAEQAGLELVCGIELNARLSADDGRSVHLLAYFMTGLPSQEFSKWLEGDKSKRLATTGSLARSVSGAREVIKLVRNTGGLPVIAHPVRLKLEREEERDLLESLKEGGLAGLEIYHSEHSPQLQAYYHQLALELKLLPTGGSDFHGALKPDVHLGTGKDGNVRVPYEFLLGLQQAVTA